MIKHSGQHSSAYQQLHLYKPKDDVISNIHYKLRKAHNDLKTRKAPPNVIDGWREIDQRAVEFTSYFMEVISPLVKQKKIVPVDVFDASAYNGYADSETGRLEIALMSLPTYLDYAKPICENEAIYPKPDRLELTYQQTGYILNLVEEGVQVVLLKPRYSINPAKFYEMTFVRDPFIQEKNVSIMCNMAVEIRKTEEELYVGGVRPPPEVIIEGGNFKKINQNLAVLAVGDRTNEIAPEWLQYTLDKHGADVEVLPLKLKVSEGEIFGTLHYDCAELYIRSRNSSVADALLVHPEAFADPSQVELIKKIRKEQKRPMQYGELTKDQFTKLDANVIYVDEHYVITNIETPDVKEEFLKRGYKVSEHFYGFYKVGGSKRCNLNDILRMAVSNGNGFAYSL